jgi:hypothetical protein
MQIPQTLKMELPYDPAIPLLCIFSKESKSAYYRDTSVPMFIAAPFTVVTLWTQPRYPSVNE